MEYAVKVPMWPWLNLRGIVKRKKERDWQWVDRRAGLQGLFAELPVPQWNRTERIAIYRKRINHKPAKGRQLELFNPDDGYWEYSVVATNKATEKRLCFRIDPHANLQRQHGLAETEHSGAQLDDNVSASHHRDQEATHGQEDRALPASLGHHIALRVAESGRPLAPTRRQPDPALGRQ